MIDDYGHHPVEIAAVLKAARESEQRQDHRRGPAASLHSPAIAVRGILDLLQRCGCGDCRRRLCAGETPIDGIDRDHFVAGLRAHGHREVIGLPAAPELAGIVKGLAKPGDLVVCLGAGNITQWAYALPNELKALG